MKKSKIDRNSDNTRNANEYTRIMQQTGQKPLNRAERRAAKKRKGN